MLLAIPTLPTTQIRIQRPEGELVADRAGSGPAIVLVPGLGDLRNSYRHLAPLLVDAGYTVYSLDLRGHGDSDASFSSYTTEDIAADVIALLDQEGLATATFVGNSMAGGAAVWAALEAPERFGKLVLLNPFVRDMPAERYFRPLALLVFARPWGAWAWMAYRETLYISPPADQAEASAVLRASLADPRRLAAVRAMLRASKARVGARLHQLRADTLVIMGDRDPDYDDPRAEGERLVELLGGETRVEMVEASGHYPHTEHAEQIAASILRHIAAGEASGA